MQGKFILVYITVVWWWQQKIDYCTTRMNLYLHSPGYSIQFHALLSLLHPPSSFNSQSRSLPSQREISSHSYSV